VSADYSRSSCAFLAHLSQDERLLTAFREDKDIHAATASEVFGVPMTGVTPDMRRVAKVVNFGIIYGMTTTDWSRPPSCHVTRRPSSLRPTSKDTPE